MSEPSATSPDRSCCVNCVHFVFDPGSPGFSEMTPGSDMLLYCSLDHWDTTFRRNRPKNHLWVCCQEDFKKAMAMSRTCEDFKGIEP